jgi:hypothetical protein
LGTAAALCAKRKAARSASVKSGLVFPDRGDLRVFDLRVMCAFAGMRDAILAARRFARHMRNERAKLARGFVRRIIHRLAELAEGLEQLRLHRHDELRVRQESHALLGLGKEGLELGDALAPERLHA